jgi:hypothetical protein
MIALYWSIGADIVAKQAESAWGSGIIPQLSADLRAEFPDMQGFSDRNISSMKKFYLFYIQEDTIWQQPTYWQSTIKCAIRRIMTPSGC